MDNGIVIFNMNKPRSKKVEFAMSFCRDGTQTTLTYVFLAIFAMATIVLLILLCSGWKLKKKHIRSKKTNKGDSESM